MLSKAGIDTTVGKRGPEPHLERAGAHLDPHEAGCSVDGQRVPGEGVEALAIEALPGFQAHGRHAALPLAACRQHREFRASLANSSLFYLMVRCCQVLGFGWLRPALATSVCA